jgi:hypothetical protein
LVLLEFPYILPFRSSLTLLLKAYPAVLVSASHKTIEPFEGRVVVELQTSVIETHLEPLEESTVLTVPSLVYEEHAEHEEHEDDRLLSLYELPFSVFDQAVIARHQKEEISLQSV